MQYHFQVGVNYSHYNTLHQIMAIFHIHAESLSGMANVSHQRAKLDSAAMCVMS